MEDPTRDYSKLQRGPCHRWTREQHITLAFLTRTYVNSWKDKAVGFNSYFSSELPNPKGLSSAALAAMYHDMKRGKLGKEAMGLLQQTAFSFMKDPTLVDQDLIERTATNIGIHLIERAPGALSTGIEPPKRQQRTKRKVALDDDSEHETTPRTPKKRQRLEQVPQTPDGQSNLGVRNGLLTPPATVGKESDFIPKRLPPVAYRAFSSQSQGTYSREQGFCAGAFVGCDVPHPPNPQRQEYIDEAKRVREPLLTYPLVRW